MRRVWKGKDCQNNGSEKRPKKNHVILQKNVNFYFHIKRFTSSNNTDVSKIIIHRKLRFKLTMTTFILLPLPLTAQFPHSSFSLTTYVLHYFKLYYFNRFLLFFFFLSFFAVYSRSVNCSYCFLFYSFIMTFYTYIFFCCILTTSFYHEKFFPFLNHINISTFYSVCIYLYE